MIADPVNILIILGIVAIILIWGPKKIPELARSISQAKKELENAKQEVEKIGIRREEDKP